MKQRTLAGQSGFERYTKKTRRELFLEEMEQVVPWAELCALIGPVYPKVGQGRPPEAKVRSKAEHVFAVMKLKLGYVKVRYRGIAKNANRLFTTFVLANLFLARLQLMV